MQDPFMGDADDLEERLLKTILDQKASGAPWDPSMVAGMEADLAKVNEIRGATSSGKLPPPALPRMGSEAWGSWQQTADAISFELRVDHYTTPTTLTALRAADVRVEALCGFLDVRCKDEPLLSGRLAQPVLTEEVEWALDEDSDGLKVLCVELTKRKATVAVDEMGRFAEPIFESVRVAGEECLLPGMVAGRVLDE